MSETPVLHLYEVGIGSDTTIVEAPSGGAAAVYYGLRLVNTNNPFMAAVYHEDGKPYEGDSWWMAFDPQESHVKMAAGRIKPELAFCKEAARCEHCGKPTLSAELVAAWRGIGSICIKCTDAHTEHYWQAWVTQYHPEAISLVFVPAINMLVMWEGDVKVIWFIRDDGMLWIGNVSEGDEPENISLVEVADVDPVGLISF